MYKLELTNELETMLICAERYACGRESYMPSLVIDYITPLLPKLSLKTLGALDRDMRMKAGEIGEYPRGHGPFGNDTIDKPLWMQFWQAVKDEIARRQG